MTEKTKFYVLLVLFILSLILVWFVRSNVGQDFVRGL